MASEAVSQQHAFEAGRLDAGSDNWGDRFWEALIGAVDSRLRAYYGIKEFTEDPRCVLRAATIPAPAAAALSDGTVIEAGALIGELHLWNEHLPRYAKVGPDLGWACTARRRFIHSMRLLAARAEYDPELRQVPAFRAEAMLATRLGLTQLERLAGRLGFEAIAIAPTTLGALHTLGASLNVWCLTRAFNPGALPRQRWRRERHELWISRAELIARYGRGAANPRAGLDSAGRRAAAPT
ncbi:MAG TPA: hypothetical protein VHU15_09715 [Stellaceae bacterium]|jgi:hypothetical protein|nr:hypothetical protein [Stellaceae bacterium]